MIELIDLWLRETDNPETSTLRAPKREKIVDNKNARRPLNWRLLEKENVD